MKERILCFFRALKLLLWAKTAMASHVTHNQPITCLALGITVFNLLLNESATLEAVISLHQLCGNSHDRPVLTNLWLLSSLKVSVSGFHSTYQTIGRRPLMGARLSVRAIKHMEPKKNADSYPGPIRINITIIMCVCRENCNLFNMKSTAN